MSAGGHGVPKNHSLAHVHYLDAHDAGHWRAPHALAITHQRGLGVKANCSAAREYIQTFVRERSGWADQMDEALLAVDAGALLCLSCYLHCISMCFTCYSACCTDLCNAEWLSLLYMPALHAAT